MVPKYPPEHTGYLSNAAALVPSHTDVRAAHALLEALDASRGSWYGGARLTVLRRGDRNTVFRAASTERGTDAPTVIVKLVGADTSLADTDVRCMLALSRCNVVPDVLLGLEGGRGYVMRDAGDNTLERILEQRTATDASEAVHRMARIYARLHVEGRSRVACTEALREGELTREFVPWMDALQRSLSWLRLDPNDARARRAVGRITTAWYAARRFLTLTHGDPAPSNILFTPPPEGDARLIDFEYASPRHPAYDLCVWDSLCPLPIEMVDAYRESYAAERAALGWAVTEEEECDYAALVTYRVLALLSWIPTRARECDEPWVGQWSARCAVVAALERLAHRGVGDGSLFPLAARALECAHSWRARWPEVGDALPPWPALRNSPRAIPRDASPAPR